MYFCPSSSFFKPYKTPFQKKTAVQTLHALSKIYFVYISVNSYFSALQVIVPGPKAGSWPQICQFFVFSLDCSCIQWHWCYSWIPPSLYDKLGVYCFWHTWCEAYLTHSVETDCSIKCHWSAVSDLYPLYFSECNKTKFKPHRSLTRTRTSV